MNSYESHIRNIIRILLGASRPLTLTAVAELIGISKRSVHNYLGRIEEWISSNGLLETALIRRQGVGISLSTSPADRKKIERLLLGSRLNVFSDDFKRRADIIQLLLMSEEGLTIQKLADAHYVSRTVTIHDLEWADQWFSQYGLELYKAQRSGIGLEGPERARRNAIAAFFDLFDNHSSDERVKSPGESTRLAKKDLEILTKYCPYDSIAKIEKIVSSAEKEFNFLMTGDYYVSLITHLAICVSRITGGNPVSEEFAPPEEGLPAMEIKTAGFIAGQLQAAFGVELDDREKAYICIHLMGYNAFSHDTGEILVPNDIEQLTESLIELMDSLLKGYDFSGDVMLFLGLCMHLKTAVFRLRNGIYLKRRWDASLPDTGLTIHYAANSAASLYDKYCGVSPDDEELNSLAQYFLLSSRRSRKQKKALLVCSLGISERIELLNEIETHVASVVIADCCTALQMPYQPEYEYDFIIAAENLADRFDKPVIYLAGVPRDSYIDTISKFVIESF